MTVFGLTNEGFVPKTLDDCKTELEERLRAAFGQSIDLAPQSVYGQFVGIMAEREAELWDVAQAVHAAFDPDRSTGSSLDSVCAITGTLRNEPRESTVLLTCTGTPGTVLAAGRTSSVVTVGTKFPTQASATIVAVSAWVTAHAYVVGDRVSKGGNVYLCTFPGTSGVFGPSGTGSNIPDAFLFWRWLGAGSGAVDVLAQSQEKGPFAALAFTLTVIETPVSGWNGVTNVLDALPGANVEDDASLRVRREEELTAESNATTFAIKAALDKVGEGTNNPVVSCKVFENKSMITDGNGLSPKSVEALVQGGADADIYSTLLKKVAAGIETHGTQSTTLTDSSGNPQVIKFSRPTAKPIYVIQNVTVDPDKFPVTGAAQIIAIIGALKYPIGLDVDATAIAARVWAVPGILRADLAKISLSPSPTLSTTIVCGNHDQAIFDTSRVTVIVTNGSP